MIFCLRQMPVTAAFLRELMKSAVRILGACSFLLWLDRHARRVVCAS
jgi:hypothetical protein